MADPRDVTIVANEIGAIGGMDRQLRILIAGLLAAGDRVTVVSRSCACPPHPRFCWIRVRGPSRPFAVAFPWFFVASTLRLHRHRTGVLHLTGAISYARADVTTVHLLHHGLSQQGGLARHSRDTPMYRLNARIARRLALLTERIAYRSTRTRAVIAVSRGVEAEISEHMPTLSDRIHVIPNGVNCDEFTPDPQARAEIRRSLSITSDALLAIFVGGDWSRKGLEHVIGALARCPRWELLVVGEGDPDNFADRFSKEDTRKRVHFLGRRHDVERLYAAADAFVLPTAYETFSLATYEAAASGLPLLSTKVSGVEDILEDGRNGWFIPRDAEAIADRLTELEDPKRRVDFGVRARHAAEVYDWPSHVRRHRELYELLR